MPFVMEDVTTQIDRAKPASSNEPISPSSKAATTAAFIASATAAAAGPLVSSPKPKINSPSDNGGFDKPVPAAVADAPTQPESGILSRSVALQLRFFVFFSFSCHCAR
jgi:hypothetical protein